MAPLLNCPNRTTRVNNNIRQAALEYSAPSTDLVPRPSFADVFADVQSAKVDYGVVPFENSSNGAVVQTLDLLIDIKDLYPDIRVCDEHYFTVHHCLLWKDAGHGEDQPLGRRLGKIQKLYTHPQAWGQCEAFLTRCLKGVERQDVSSTSKAAQMVSEDSSGSCAAIASKLAGETCGLQAAAENIEDRADNMTRFFVLRKATWIKEERESRDSIKEPPNNSEQQGLARWKSLISFTIDHAVPGALANALNVFKQNGLNLTSIDTRPSREMPWHYVFFVECQEARHKETDDRNIQSMISSLRKLTQNCKHLGTWQEYEQKDSYK